MNTNLLDQLLNESESAYLDFKRDQYSFEGSDDDTKGELLKDILAFANAWRRTDAYILIGVEEVRGDRNKVVGISKHIEDHSLQQFVNSKTQQPITFSYIPIAFEGLQIGVIKIPVQARPIYLKKDFGKLKKNVVYLRRGSSTDEASPDEIAKMGASDINGVNNVVINLEFADLNLQNGLGNTIIINSGILEIASKPIPAFTDNTSGIFLNSLSSSPNKKYYKQLVDYIGERLLTKPVGFTLKNLGQSTIHNVKMIITFEGETNLMVLMEDDLSPQPKKYFNYLSDTTYSHSLTNASNSSNTSLKIYDKKHVFNVEFGDVQPKMSAWSDEPLFIGRRVDGVLTLNANIFADELQEPLVIDLVLSFKTVNVDLSLNDIEKGIDEEHKRLFDELDN